jgi:hypothetical protein
MPNGTCLDELLLYSQTTLPCDVGPREKIMLPNQTLLFLLGGDSTLKKPI